MSDEPETYTYVQKTTLQEITVVEYTKAEQVDETLLAAARETFDGWFADEERIDWEEFWRRMEGAYQYKGEWVELSLGPEEDSPAMRKIQRHIRAYKNEG